MRLVGVLMRNCYIENAPCFLAAVLLDPLDFAIRSGAPVYVTEGVGSFAADVEFEEGDDLSLSGWAPTRSRWTLVGDRTETSLTLTGEFITKDWSMFADLVGPATTAVMSGDYANTIGVEHCLAFGGPFVAARKPAVALCIITAAELEAGAVDAERCVGQFWPLTTSWQVSVGEKSAEGTAAVKFTARAYPAPDDSSGVLNLWPASATPNKVRAGMAVSEALVSCSAVPEVWCGSKPHPPLPGEPSMPVALRPATRIIGDSNTAGGATWATQLSCSPTVWAWGGVGVFWGASGGPFTGYWLDHDAAIMLGGVTGDHVVIMLGTNDIASGPQEPPTQTQLNAVARKVILAGAASVRWMTVLPFGKNVYSERRQARLDAWNAAILRTPDAIDARGCFGEFLSPIYQSDGTHLNPLGHTTFADYVSPLICS